MIIATVLSSTALLLKTTDLLGLHFDYIALVMPINVIALYLAIFRHDFFEIQELAFEKAFDSSRDSMLIIDNYFSVLDYNKEAVELFNYLGMALEKKKIQDIIEEKPELVDTLLKAEDRTVKLEIQGLMHYYTVQSNKIFDNQNRESGRLYVIRDTTKEQQLHESGQELY